MFGSSSISVAFKAATAIAGAVFFPTGSNKMDIGLMIEHNQINTNAYFKVNYHL